MGKLSVILLRQDRPQDFQSILAVRAMPKQTTFTSHSHTPASYLLSCSLVQTKRLKADSMHKTLLPPQSPSRLNPNHQPPLHHFVAFLYFIGHMGQKYSADEIRSKGLSSSKRHLYCLKFWPTPFGETLVLNTSATFIFRIPSPWTGTSGNSLEKIIVRDQGCLGELCLAGAEAEGYITLLSFNMDFSASNQAQWRTPGNGL